MENLYLKIIDKFNANKSLFIKHAAPIVQHIDLYRGQPLAPDRFELFGLPALFIEYNIDWERGKVTISAHVVTDSTQSTSSISPNRLTGLQIFKLYKVVKHLLKGLSSETTGKLKLTSEHPIESDVVNYQVFDFEASIIETPLEDKFAEGTIESLNNNKKLRYSV